MGIWFRLALIVIAIVIGALELYRQRAISPEPSLASPAPRPLARAEIGIEGMDCLMCAAGLQNKLRTLRGVSKAEVSYQDKRATVEFDPTVVGRALLVAAITSDGFKVVAQDSSPEALNPPPTRLR